MVTAFLAQLALTFGADDIEGTVVYERVYHEAGAETPMHMTYDDLVRLIRGAGKVPVERDSLYNEVRGPGFGVRGNGSPATEVPPESRTPNPVSTAE